ncbi:helix-turn-helix domain-containing protein [Kordiimonas sp.]|uniref:helix-turn-helix domain-containing protein n=1 Tax=Kordiimonas sp. TaxID=1970157 RepID=UPI003A90A5E1
MTNEKKTVGELLKEARIVQKLDMDTVAKDICVRASYLNAIETGCHEALPGNTFTIGFVRSYAKALSLDAENIVRAFKDELGIKSVPLMVGVQSVAAKRSAKPARRLPGWLSPLGGVAGAALVWAFMGNAAAPFTFFTDSELVDPATDTAQLMAVQALLEEGGMDTAHVLPEKVGDVQVTRLSDDGILDADPAREEASRMASVPQLPHSLFLPAANAMATTDEGEGRTDILLSAEEDAWIRLAKKDGTEVWSGILREGQSYRPLLEGAVLLSTSNAGGVKLTVGKRQISSLGERGQVIEGLSLDGEKLLSDVSQTSRSVTGSR